MSDSFSGNSIASIHNHANNRYTIGMGEVVAVLNGVEFRTRHNDYPLHQPSTLSSLFQATQPIDTPPVPPEVLKQDTVSKQVKIMREYFKAFKNQDTSVYDYKPYFKPVLCYMEGKWTERHDVIDESFDSDRHFYDADTYTEMEDQIRFMSYSGSKDTLENKGYLPSQIYGVDNGTIPKIAQWTYRILCHPMSKDLPFSKLELLDDVSTRMRYRLTMDALLTKRSARFQLRKSEQRKKEEFTRYSLLDEVMSEIPGLDNYGATLRDDAYHGTTKDASKGRILNTAYYHRTYSAGKDAMGGSTRYRGFSDQNLFMAMNTQSEVVGMSETSCRKINNGKRKCETTAQKWSYAIPLEVIYMTPLTKWNPYNLTFSSNNNVPTLGGRNGRSAGKALDGTSRKNFYQTPAEFFSGETDEDADSADTSGQIVWVQDPEGVARKVRESGYSIIIPEISEVGKIRQRWPIPPLHAEGSVEQKEITALRDIVLNPKKYAHMYYEDPNIGGNTVTFTTPTKQNFYWTPPAFAGSPFTSHKHEVMITKGKMNMLRKGQQRRVTTDQASGHTHVLRLGMVTENGVEKIKILKCDGNDLKCKDGHEGFLTEE